MMMLRNIDILPFMLLAVAHHPQIMSIMTGFAYITLYKWTIQDLTQSFVIKMELVP